MRRRKPRNRLSLTSLIDVIFLLLLFFMLSSTFSRFAEVPLPLGSQGQAGASDTPPVFLRLTEEALTVNGRESEVAELSAALNGISPDEKQVILSTTDDVSSQRLIDVLAALRGMQNTAVHVLVPS